MIKEFATINPGPRNEYNGEVLKSGLEEQLTKSYSRGDK